MARFIMALLGCLALASAASQVQAAAAGPTNTVRAAASGQRTGVTSTAARVIIAGSGPLLMNTSGYC